MTTILVAEDEKIIRELLTGKLRERGYKVLEAADGVEALTIIKSERPDIVILDLLMPKMEGIEVCRVVKENQELINIKIIVFTAKDELKKRREALQYGADYYLTKPARFSEIINIIKKIEK